MQPLNPRISACLSVWFPFAALATILCGFAYVAVQQDERLSANEPQIQMAEELSQFDTPSQVISDDGSDVAKTLAPFAATYDESGSATAWTATLDGSAPQPPKGIFAYVQANGQDRVTWQPRPGLRFAVVAMKAAAPGQGYVLAARSLRETEAREKLLGMQALFAWISALLVTGVWAWFVSDRRQQPPAA